MDRLNPPRLTIDLTEEQDRKLRNLVPWGQKKALFYKLIDEIIFILDSLEEGGRAVALGAIISGRISILDLMREEEKKSRKKKK